MDLLRNFVTGECPINTFDDGYNCKSNNQLINFIPFFVSIFNPPAYNLDNSLKSNRKTFHSLSGISASTSFLFSFSYLPYKL